ncbi:FecR family protein [Luteimonas sp. SDU101]|uniref:FecR family protein n=1 Tax=Luteimonas sp. SDU101 TaxID=3422593 RepID=UPI003EB912D1
MHEGRRAAEEAAGWVVRLDSGDCSAGELDAFERWRDADPLHAVAYRQARTMWGDSSAVIRDSLALGEAARQALRQPPEHAAPRRRRRLVASFAAAATVAAMSVAALLHWPPSEPEPPLGTRYATAAGEQRTVVLADGSTLTLDTQTVVVERYSRQERRIDLTQGQVQFEVKGDPDRPLVVHAGGGTITAIGTRFQIRVAEAGTAVTLLQGVVHVAARTMDGNARIDALQAGQRIRFDVDGRLGEVEQADLRAVEGWMEGKLYVDDWPLRDFVAELNRYSTIQLRIADPSLDEVRMSGVFQTRDRANLEELLAQGWGIHSRPVAPNEILLTRR